MNVCWRVAVVLLSILALAGTAQAQWSDEFNGSGAVSSSTWGYDVGGGGWGNNELEYYQSGTANANQAGGFLTIQARQQSVGGMAYTSARLKTQGIRTFSQGSKLEARLRGPNGQGLWPAFWALGANITSVPWPGCGEIDVMEHINSVGNTFGTIHWDLGGYQFYTAAQPAVNFTAWNNYGIEWSSSLIRWTLNGSYVGDANIAGGINGTDEFGPGKPFFVILNLAVGGNWPGAPNGTAAFPANMDVDWLRVTNGTATATPTSATPTPTSGPVSGVQLFQDCNYGGTASQGFPAGSYNLAAMQARGAANDWASSVRVPAGMSVTLYQNDNFTGTSVTLTADNSCLVGNSFNDLTTSMIVSNTSATPTRTAATATPTTGGGTGNCAGVAAFANCTAYANGAKVVFNNTLYHSIAAIPATRDCPPNSPFNPSNDNWWVNDGACSGGATPTATSRPGATATRTNTATATRAATATATTGSTPTPAPGCVGCTHKRLKVINGCGQPIWMQYLNGNGGGTLSAPNRFRLGSLGSSIEYDIPDIGIAGVRFWPGMGCDANGQNCTIGASGGPASMGFTCPAAGCGPPVDSKFEATFGCMTGTGCQGNPSGGGAPLGNLDWWNTSAVDGYTLPFQVRAIGACPTGPQPTGPGGPPGGMTSCANLRMADCPTNENLSSNGQFPNLSSVNLRLTNPATGAQAGCFSPSGKMTFSQWNAGFATYPPQDPHAQWYSCPTPPITPQQCSAGPANSTAYRNVIHSKCTNTYAYAYDDTFGLATCPAAANMTYEVTFYCPQ